MLNLPPRLNMAANMVRPGSVAADIGTDHAFLPSFLILQGISPRAIACDVRQGPLENARKTVERYGIVDKIDLVLSDGLDSLAEGCAQDIILCGMGGTLIVELIERIPWLKSCDIRLIIQAQSHAEDVRAFFIANGFEILREETCADSGRVYSAMCAEYTGIEREYPPEFPYCGLLNVNEPTAKIIIERTLARLQKRLSALKECGKHEQEEKYLSSVIPGLKIKLTEAKNADC